MKGQTEIGVAESLATMLTEHAKTSKIDINGVVEALNDKVKASSKPPPEPVDPRNYLNKKILFQGSNMFMVSQGIIRQVSKNGLLKVEEMHEQNGQKIITINWHKPQDFYILDELDE